MDAMGMEPIPVDKVDAESVFHQSPIISCQKDWVLLVNILQIIIFLSIASTHEILISHLLELMQCIYDIHLEFL